MNNNETKDNSPKKGFSQSNYPVDKYSDSMVKGVKNTIFRGEVSYDISLIPEGYTMDQIIDIYTKSGILIFDASKGLPPVFNLKK